MKCSKPGFYHFSLKIDVGQRSSTAHVNIEVQDRVRLFLRSPQASKPAQMLHMFRSDHRDHYYRYLDTQGASGLSFGFVVNDDLQNVMGKDPKLSSVDANWRFQAIHPKGEYFQWKNPGVDRVKISFDLNNGEVGIRPARVHEFTYQPTADERLPRGMAIESVELLGNFNHFDGELEPMVADRGGIYRT